MVFLAAIIGSLVNNKLERMCKEALIVHRKATYRKLAAPYTGREREENDNPQSEQLVLLRYLKPKPPN